MFNPVIASYFCYVCAFLSFFTMATLTPMMVSARDTFTVIIGIAILVMFQVPVLAFFIWQGTRFAKEARKKYHETKKEK